MYRKPQKKVKTKSTNRVGKKRQCNMSGWSNDGIQFYNSVCASWRALSQDTTWTTFEEEWAAYKDKTNFGHSSRREKDDMKNQKMTTTTMEENNVRIFHYGTNSSCWMEMKISWMSDRPLRK